MRHRIRAGFCCDFDQPLGDQGSRDRGAKQIKTLIQRIGPEHRKHEIPHELFAQILDMDVFFLDPQQQRLGARGFQFFALTEVGGEGHHFAAIFVLQPFQDNRGIKTPRIG
jgi:hypothetical protein